MRSCCTAFMQVKYLASCPSTGKRTIQGIQVRSIPLSGFYSSNTWANRIEWFPPQNPETTRWLRHVYEYYCQEEPEPLSLCDTFGHHDKWTYCDCTDTHQGTKRRSRQLNRINAMIQARLFLDCWQSTKLQKYDRTSALSTISTWQPSYSAFQGVNVKNKHRMHSHWQDVYHEVMQTDEESMTTNSLTIRQVASVFPTSPGGRHFKQLKWHWKLDHFIGYPTKLGDCKITHRTPHKLLNFLLLFHHFKTSRKGVSTIL